MNTKTNYWPLGIVTAFVIFIGGMATAVVIASCHRDSLVDKDYYEQELKFQGQIDAVRQARDAGAKLVYDAAVGQVVITLPPAQLTQKLSGTITFYRANDAKLDRELLLEPKADGTQTLNVANFVPGSWLVRVKWQADGKNFHLEQKIIVPAK
jgi:hypothetical protein